MSASNPHSPVERVFHGEVIGPRERWPRKYPPASPLERRLQAIVFLAGGLLFWGAIIFALGRGLGAW